MIRERPCSLRLHVHLPFQSNSTCLPIPTACWWTQEVATPKPSGLRTLVPRPDFDSPLEPPYRKRRPLVLTRSRGPFHPSTAPALKSIAVRRRHDGNTGLPLQGGQKRNPMRFTASWGWHKRGKESPRTLAKATISCAINQSAGGEPATTLTFYTGRSPCQQQKSTFFPADSFRISPKISLHNLLVLGDLRSRPQNQDFFEQHPSHPWTVRSLPGCSAIHCAFG